MSEDAGGQPSITVRPAGAGLLCSDRGHARRYVTAAVVAEFGQMPRLAWAECSGRCYPFCGPCWDRTRATAERLVPGIEIRAGNEPGRQGTPARA
jgi:hypothetical protein